MVLCLNQSDIDGGVQLRQANREEGISYLFEISSFLSASAALVRQSSRSAKSKFNSETKHDWYSGFRGGYDLFVDYLISLII